MNMTIPLQGVEACQQVVVLTQVAVLTHGLNTPCALAQLHKGVSSNCALTLSPVSARIVARRLESILPGDVGFHRQGPEEWRGAGALLGGGEL